VSRVEPAPALATAQQVAVAWLRRAIAAGALRPGDRIGQDAVAVQIGVSLIPVREALRMLESEGLVTYVPRRGYFVAELDIGDLEEIYRLRKLLETDAVARGLPAATDEVLAGIAEAASECRQAAAEGDVARALAANRRFHFALCALADSDPALRLIRFLWDATEPYRALYYGTADGEAEADAAHRAILDAAHRRDVEACVDALDRHRERALAALRAVLQP
jgi:DNA-binding GntR family transcriptional regulator